MTDELPGARTGSTYYDRLVFQDEAFFETWKIRLAARNYALIKVALDKDTLAQVNPFSRTFEVDPIKTRYIHFLYERHHLRQFIRLERQGYDLMEALWDRRAGRITKIHHWLELGAYEYLERLGKVHHFSAEFMRYTRFQQAEYWNPTLQRRYRQSPSIKQRLDAIWR
jgi:hypothetical protein